MKIYRNVFKSPKSFYSSNFIYQSEEEAHEDASNINHANGETDLYQFTIVEEIQTINIKNDKDRDIGRPDRKRGSERV